MARPGGPGCLGSDRRRRGQQGRDSRKLVLILHPNLKALFPIADLIRICFRTQPKTANPLDPTVCSAVTPILSPRDLLTVTSVPATVPQRLRRPATPQGRGGGFGRCGARWPCLACLSGLAGLALRVRSQSIDWVHRDGIGRVGSGGRGVAGVDGCR